MSPGAPGVEGRLTGAGHRAVQPELEASAWGREGADAGVHGGRTRSRTLGHVDGTSEGGAYAGRSEAGPRPERALLCSADSSRFFRERVLF